MTYYEFSEYLWSALFGWSKAEHAIFHEKVKCVACAIECEYERDRETIKDILRYDEIVTTEDMEAMMKFLDKYPDLTKNLYHKRFLIIQECYDLIMKGKMPDILDIAARHKFLQF